MDKNRGFGGVMFAEVLGPLVELGWLKQDLIVWMGGRGG